MNATQAPLRLMFGTLLLALAACFAQPAPAAPHDGPPPGGPMMMMGPKHIERMLDAANASADQRTQIKSIVDAAQADLKAQREASRSLHEQSMALFTQPTVDARAAESLRQQMLAQHDSASKRMLQAMLDVSRVLTADQRQQLAERVKQHRAAMGEPGSRPAR